jgi:hypothetical protein
MLEQLAWADAHLLGVVISRIPRRGGSYYGSYRHYYGPDYYAETGREISQHSNGQGPGKKQEQGGRSHRRLRLRAG